MTTLPQLARSISDCSLDVLRGIIRNHPELRAMGKVYGVTRLFNEAVAEQIRAAYEARQAGRMAAKC